VRTTRTTLASQHWDGWQNKGERWMPRLEKAMKDVA
jgi:hypothetical protein